MKAKYGDITSRIGDPPLWWDDNGVPRYEPFHPDLLPNIYANEAVLFLIRCQACQHEFHVSLCRDAHEFPPSVRTLQESIPHIYYGDPPNTGCCSVGPTMSSDSIRILEFWVKEKLYWVRHPELEVELEDD